MGGNREQGSGSVGISTSADSEVEHLGYSLPLG
jgi:hypothetical protein